jgi:hypothetical protein
MLPSSILTITYGPLPMGIRNLSGFSEYKLPAKSCWRSQSLGRESNRGSRRMKAGFQVLFLLEKYKIQLSKH